MNTGGADKVYSGDSNESTEVQLELQQVVRIDLKNGLHRLLRTEQRETVIVMGTVS